MWLTSSRNRTLAAPDWGERNEVWDEKIHALRLAMMCNRGESHASCAQIRVAGLQTSTPRNQVSSQAQAHKMTTTTPHVQAPTTSVYSPRLAHISSGQLAWGHGWRAIDERTVTFRALRTQRRPSAVKYAKPTCCWWVADVAVPVEPGLKLRECDASESLSWRWHLGSRFDHDARCGVQVYACGSHLLFDCS